jgi:hypothetical protein
MCPLCLATVGVMVSGAAVLMKKVRATSKQDPHAAQDAEETEESKERQPAR